ELILNLKDLAIKVHANGSPDDEARTLRIEKKGEGDVTGADIEVPADVEIVNPEVHIATLADENAALDMELTVEVNKGYMLPEKHERFKNQIGVIPVGSAFTPVRKVNYALEATRVGTRSDLERLILEIWTNGAIAPGEALSQAARILDGYVQLFFDVSSERVARSIQEGGLARRSEPKAPDARIEELDFSVRTYNCLKKANIQTVADLVMTTETRAKEVRRMAERLITRARRGDLHSRRIARRVVATTTPNEEGALSGESYVNRLFDEIAPKFKDRPGGYTRIIHIGFRRGD